MSPAALCLLGLGFFLGAAFGQVSGALGLVLCVTVPCGLFALARMRPYAREERL